MMTKNREGWNFLPWQLGMGVALIGFVCSALLGRQLNESANQMERARFAQAANSATESLARRIDAYTEIAFGLRGLFIVDPALNRRSFIDAVSHLNVEQRYPGIKNIAFTRYVNGDEKAQFERRVRADTSVQPQGYPDFKIHPPGERKEYFVADYLWPMTGNSGIHGLDISAQPANLESMRHSQISGESVASAPFDLLQETSHRTGFVIRVPVFDGGQKTSTAETRTKRFLGSVAVTLKIFDLFEQLEREGNLEGLQLSMSDLGAIGKHNPAIANANANVLLFSTPPNLIDSPHQYTRELHVYGRAWKLDFRPGRSFLSSAERNAAMFAGLTGALFSLLLGSLVLLLARGRHRALQSAAAKGEELESSEGRWKFAIEGSGDGLWDWNVTQNTVFYSSRWKEVLGFSNDEIGNSPADWSSRIHADDVTLAISDLQGLLSGAKQHFVNEHRIGCKDGSWKWFLGHAAVVSRNEVGNPLRVIGTHRDITEQKLQNLELHKSENNIRTLIEQSPIAMIVENAADGQVLLMNKKFTELFGYTLDDIPTVNLWWPLAYPDQKYRSQLIGEWAVQTEKTKRNIEKVEPIEATVTCKDGSVRFIRFSLASISGNNIVGFEDLTVRKQTEDALRRSQSFLDSIIECSPSALWISDEHGTLIRMNQALRDRLKVRDDEVVGKYNVFQDNVIEKQGVMPLVKDVFEKGAVTRFITTYNTAAVGSLDLTETVQVDLDVSISPIFDSHGRVSNAVIQHLDITNRVKAERALQASLLEKEALLKEVHHRVKNNLQVITSLLRLESGRTSETATISVLRVMQDRIRSMTLLHESIYRSGTFAAVDLGSYLRQIATQSFRALLVSPETVQLRMDMGTLKVGIDQATPCGLLVSELFSNALKHAFPNGRTGEVFLELRAIDGHGLWRLRVSDTGIGLPADFESRCQQSLGLQLAMSLASQVGGSLAIGPGSTFTLEFAVVPPALLATPAK
jgi:PAS domain S-box-containing protein